MYVQFPVLKAVQLPDVHHETTGAATAASLCNAITLYFKTSTFLIFFPPSIRVQALSSYVLRSVLLARSCIEPFPFRTLSPSPPTAPYDRYWNIVLKSQPPRPNLPSCCSSASAGYYSLALRTIRPASSAVCKCGV